MQIQPYLFFEGRAEEALEFYRKALGAQVLMMMKNREAPEKPQFQVPADKVMHACFQVGDSQVMASDGMCSGKPNFQGFALSVPAKDAADAKAKFGALAEGGQVKMPLSETFFARSFGMVNDKFGVAWMVIAGPKNLQGAP